ncbi:PLP-dependent aminotransferase family protein [Rugamonas sp. CCM 8940]|uniref:MocR-like pyridoxine biosynthesis transcription factor PdxR n=1 Tax=Rugamonas sp. CCM 8940 TaxID=2765359 RepID=UPI0018F6FD66|nr:PLP-dependent aminotransferase family protein [Rugamonas sp. CCM 8940]
MDYALLIATFTEQHRARGWPRQRLLHECLRAAIRSGTLGAGSRLVATRALAAELGVARNTVLYAYEQLACEGYVSTDRRGTIVAALAPEFAAPAAPAPHAELSRRARELRPMSGIGDSMQAFMPGVPALELFPLALWRRMLERAWRGLSVAQLNYGEPCGEAALREAIADHLRASRGVVCDAGQVFITDGTQSSLDLCARAFADHGDTAWLECPGYGGALAAFRAAGLRVEAIAVDQDGIAPTPQDWARRPPRLIYTTPSHQYPTGSVLSLRRRLALIEQARAAGALIIEDDYDSEFRHDGPPLSAMQGLAADAPVLYLGTFSKTMFPSLRIGFVVVPKGLAPALAAMRAQSAARGRVAEQLALAEFLRSGQFALHLRRMRRLYRQRRDALAAALTEHVGTVALVHGGSAGMHLALRFTDAALCDTTIAAQALELGIVTHALSAHCSHAGEGGSDWRGLMLGYAQVPAERMDGLVRQLATLLHLAAYSAKRPRRSG